MEPYSWIAQVAANLGNAGVGLEWAAKIALVMLIGERVLKYFADRAKTRADRARLAIEVGKHETDTEKTQRLWDVEEFKLLTGEQKEWRAFILTEVKRQREQMAELELKNEKLKQKNEELEEKVDHLERKLDDAERRHDECQDMLTQTRLATLSVYEVKPDQN